MKFRFSNLTVAYRTARSLSRTARSHYFGRHIVHPIFVTEDRSCFKTSRRWHGGHSHHHGGRDENDGIFKLGLAADVGLAVGKALTGYASGSTAIIADAAHSISDIVLSGVALLSYRAARAPKDKEHPYGHGKFETLGALGISCMLLATAGGIAWHALGILHSVLISNPDIIDHSLLDNHNHGGHNHAIDLDHPVLALNMTITSIAVKEGLYWITKRAGDKEGGGLLMKANAWHHRADAVSSVVALVGVGGAILGVRFLDPLAGLVVSGMIFKAGIESGYESVMELVDAGVPFSTLAPIKRTIIEVEGVMGSHRLRGRKAGSSIYLDVHVEVDPFLSVSMAHNIGENVRHQIHKCHRNIAEVFIHIDPSFEYFETTLDKRKETSNIILNENSSYSKEENQKTLVSNILSSQFSKKISVEHITRHLLQGKVFLQIQVSMPSNMLIIDATTIAKEAEKEILKADSSINQVSIQLRLGEQTPQFNNHLNKKNNHNTELYMLQNFTNPQQSE